MSRPDEPELGALSTQTADDGTPSPGVVVRGPAAHPTQIGRYRVEHLLGAGGMGVVYAARDPELARPVAIKLISPHVTAAEPFERATRRLQREAQAMARVAHPHVVSVFDVGVVGDQVFVAMELVEGATLAAWLAERERTPDEILGVFRDAARGLAAAHAAGLVHRDFKPDNVMVGRDGRVRVLDFGLARPTTAGDEALDPAAPAHPTMTHGVAGTPLYMAPEQYLGSPNADHRVDQFAFCVALYRALYRRAPFAGETYEALRAAVLAGELRPPSAEAAVPARVAAALLRGMSREPARRFPDMEALVAALVPEPPARGSRPRTLVALAGALVLAATAGVVALRARGTRVPAGPRPTVANRQLTFRGDVEGPSFSPDGTTLAYLSGEGLRLLQLDSGDDRLLTPGHFRWMTAFLPDGTSILTQDAEKHLLRITLADGRVEALLPDQAADFILPIEGGASVMMMGKTSRFEVRSLVDPLRSARECVIMPFGRVVATTASPTGTHLAVAFTNDRAELSLRTLAVDCSDQRVLDKHLGRGDSIDGLRWIARDGHDESIYVLVPGQHDGQDLVRFPVRPDGHARGERETLISDLDATGNLAVDTRGRAVYPRRNAMNNLEWYVRAPAAQVAVTNDTAERRALSLSPDHFHVAFEEQVGRKRRIVVLHVPDGRERASFPLDDDDARTAGISWSPDGDALVVTQSIGRGSKVMILPLDGGPARVLRDMHPSANTAAVWTPEGRLLAPYHLDGYYFDLEGHELTTLSNELDKPESMEWPVVSADGLEVAVSWAREPRGLYIFSSLSRASRLLDADDALHTAMPLVWAPDASWLYFTRLDLAQPDSRTNRVRRVRVADGQVEDWWTIPTRSSAIDIALGPDGEAAAVLTANQQLDLWMIDPG